MMERVKVEDGVDCGPHLPGSKAQVARVSAAAFERAAALFRAAGDISRLRLLHELDGGECCVSELAEASATKLSTLSQQLRVLHAERIIKRRREGKHIYYSLADEHVREIIRTALDHAGDPQLTPSPEEERKS
jgi:DNA-binding transcriptional ArsR family regulator